MRTDTNIAVDASDKACRLAIHKSDEILLPMGLHVFALLVRGDVGLLNKSRENTGVRPQHANELPIFLRARGKRNCDLIWYHSTGLRLVLLYHYPLTTQ